MYKFNNPGKIALRSRFDGEKNYIRTTGENWTWHDAGVPFYINWSNLDFECQIEQILKSFIVYRFESRSPRTVGTMDGRLLLEIAKSPLSSKFPWDKPDALKFLTSIRSKPYFFSFRSLYTWCVQRAIEGFDRNTLSELNEVLPVQRNAYQRAYLQTDIISPSDQLILLDKIRQDFDPDDFLALRDNVLLHLGFELAPRPTQIYSISEGDFELIAQHDKQTVYCTLWLPMAKKISSNSLGDKRPRNLSEELGKKIETLIKFNSKLFTSCSNTALFKDTFGHRMTSIKISQVVCNQLESIGFKKGDGLKFLRHNLAQALADQGSSAETIAEIMGHNSLVPARAYISSTPEIANIKTRALGKNETYKDLMKMFLTGEITDRATFSKERWPKAVVGNRYITGVGACGLSKSTPCPFDPVYSCYTCDKFHPFEDGAHSEVKDALQKQAQYFVDTANDAMELESNRTVLQLEKTIQAVDQVITRCQK